MRLIDDKLIDVASGKIKRLIISLPPRSGKQISNDTPVLTIEGWKLHGDLQIGDYVFNIEGKPCKILAVSEMKPQNYEIEFSDNEIIKCHANHEWYIYDKSCYQWYITETKEIAKYKLDSGVPNKRGHRYRFHVSGYIPIQFPEKRLLINPYILGAWLGDGSTAKNCITYSEKKLSVINKFRQLGYAPTTHNVHPITGVFTDYIKRLYAELKSENLFGNKHIPYNYLFSSIEQRKELLAGLIDTDGCIDKTGRIKYSTTLPELAEQVQFLIHSLGQNAHINKIQPRTSSSGIHGRKIVYTIAFNSFDLPTVRIKTENIKHVNKRRAIISIRKTKECYGKCIQVEGGIYLVGRTLIPTHNSWLVSEFFPAWYLGINPKKKVRLVSHDKISATNWCRHSLQHFKETKDLFSIYHNKELEISKETESNWEIAEYHGLMESIGVHGQLLSKGADLLIVDDPSTPEEANSVFQSDKLWDWFRRTIYPRLEPDGAIIIVAQRLSDKDLIGRILENLMDVENWEHIKLPAYAEANDILGRQEGEPLWETRWNKDTLENIRKTVGTWVWSSQYQQNPLTSEFVIFKPKYWVFYERADEKYNIVIQVWDTAYKDKKQNDYSVCLTLGLANNYIDILDMYRDKPSILELDNQARRLAMMYHANRILIEDKGSGTSLLQILKKATLLPIQEERAMNKVERAHIASPFCERRQVRLPAGATWLPTFINEMTAFPNGIHDDIVDTFGMGIIYLSKFFGKTNGVSHGKKIRPEKIRDKLIGY